MVWNGMAWHGIWSNPATNHPTTHASNTVHAMRNTLAGKQKFDAVSAVDVLFQTFVVTQLAPSSTQFW